MAQSKLNMQSLLKIKKVVKQLNTVERIGICDGSFGDMGAKILGLGLLKNIKLLYLVLRIFLKQ